MKRKLDEFKNDSEFRFWGIVISRFVWDYTRSEVSGKFGCSEQYVTKVMKKFDEDGGYMDHRQFNGGHNKKAVTPVKTALVETIREEPSITSAQISIKLTEEGFDIPSRTVRKVRSDIGFTKIKPQTLPLLSEDNKLKRLTYCEDYKEDKFSNVCFSDESCFQLSANRQVLWYRRGEDDKPIQTVPKSNKKIMVWGGISRKGQTPLFIYRLDEGERVNKETYVECLDYNLLDFMDNKFGYKKWRFIQDNARPHTAEYTKDFLEEADVKLIGHPPYSPDLNPIEKIWAWMKSDIGKSSYEDIENLIEVVKEKWESLSNDFLNKLIDNHIKTILKVLEADGNYV